MTRKPAFWLAWFLWTLTPASLAAGVILGLATDTFQADGPFIVLIPAFLLAFATVGALVGSRRPENAIGWILLATSVAWSLVTIADSYAIYAARSGNTASILARISDWVNFWFYGAAIVLPVTLLLLLFPSGHLPSPRWRPFLWLGVIGNGGFTVARAFDPSGASGETHFLKENPFGIETAEPVLEVLGMVSSALGVIALLAALTAIVVRFRSSRGDERQQMKWVAYAGIVVVLTLVAQGVVRAAIGLEEATAQVVFPAVILASLTLIPLSAGFAILKHRLYDIDVVIRKTVVYGALAAFITLVYVGIVVGIGTLVGSRGNLLLSVVATALIALAFQPARERARRLADRLVYGERATPYEVLSEFSDRLAESYSIEDVLPRMARVLAEGVGASAVTILLGTGRDSRPIASYPRGAALDNARTFEVRHQGQPLGGIAVTMPAGEPLGPVQEKLSSDVATQAGLVLRNAALIEELQDSRRRIVTAQDERARALERNIHDGAQQQLVSLAVKLRLAEQLVDHDPRKAKVLLEELQTDSHEAIEDLRDLARGIYPPLLADRGLAAALEAQARKSPVPVRVEAAGIGRHAQEVEAAVYFCSLEALQNVAKYANASSATLRLGRSNGDLTFELIDDGTGFDARTPSFGTGLQGMADRLAALGGSLQVRSGPGEGTTVTGTVPLGGT